MAGTLKHAFTSAAADGTDASKVRASNWNADHTFAGGSQGYLLTRDTTASDGASWASGTAFQQQRELWTTAARSVMSSPPTVTIGAANGATQIASSVSKTPTNAAFRYIGTAAGFGSTFPQSSYYAPDNLVTLATLKAAGPWGVEFMFDGQQFEWLTTGNGAKYRIAVDGQLVTAQGQSGPAADGSLYRVLVNFGSRANRRIRFDLTSNGRFGGVAIGPNDTIWKPAVPAGPSLLVLGDSFTEGTGATTSIDGFAVQMGDLLRCHVTPSGSGGTGYLNPGSGGRVKFRDRLTTDVTSRAPDIVLVAGGLNDAGSYTKAAIQAEALLLFQAIQTALPSARVYVLGPFWPNGSPTVALTDTRDAISASATAVGYSFIDNIADAWITGSGRVGATTGSGNADLYTGTDGTHPSDAGHTYLAYRIASAIAALWHW